MPGIQDSVTIDAAAVLGHYRTLVAMGAPPDLLEEVLGATEEEIEAIDARVPFLRNLQMIEKGVELLGPDVPLKLGTQVSVEKLGVCGYIFQNCKNIQELLDQFIRYQRILYAVAGHRIVNTRTTFRIEHLIKMPAYDAYTQMTVELAFSSIITVLRELVPRAPRPLEIRFGYPKPAHVRAYEEILCSPLKFDRGEDAMVFRKEELATAIPRSRPYVKEIMTQHANALMRGLEERTGFKSRVIKLAVENLPRGIVDIEMISEKLNMSRWTVTRELKKEGLTFQSLMNGLKKDIALSYLRESNLSTTEIAFLLGYTEVSAFRRAFKSWTGYPPGHFRLVTRE